MVSDIATILLESPFLAIFVVFWAGALASLSSCSLVRIPIVFGLIAGSTGSKKKPFLVLLFFVIGLIVSYTALGILLGALGDLTTKLITATKYIYAILGAMIILVGIFVTGIISSKPLNLHFHITEKFKNTGYFGAFGFGIVLSLIEMPTCPCCAPLLLIIASSVIAKGSYIYSILVFLSFAIGQSLPTIVVGTSTGLINYIIPRIERIEGYIRLIAGNILIVFGLYFIIIT